MKKIYFLGLALAGLMTANAQLSDNMDSYPVGPYFGGHWSTWSGNSSPTENIIIADDQSVSGSQSAYVGGTTVQDPILLLGEGRNSGTWTIEFKVYVDFGSGGYYNFQRQISQVGQNGNWANQIYIGMIPGATETDPPTPNPGIARVGGTEFYFEFPYPEEEWFTIRNEVNLDAGTLKYYVNGVEIETAGNEIGFVGGPGFWEGMNFYSAADFSSYFIDDITFVQGTMGIDEATSISTISVYPTLANDVINVSAKSNISEVSVYNMNGQQVLKVAGQGTSAQVNVSALPAGTYVVKTVAGKETKSTKVVVK